MGTKRFPLQVLAVGVGLSLLGSTLPGCTDFSDQKALTRLVFNGITDAGGGAFLSADGVVSEVFNITADDVTVLLSNEAVSPNVGSNELYDVLLESYQVSFRRTDGGTAVPQGFGVDFTERIPVTPFRSRPAGIQLVAVEIRLLQAQQKVLPPLVDLRNFGVEQSTGFPLIQTLATVRFFGRNLIGDPVELEVEFRVSFCNRCQA